MTDLEYETDDEFQQFDLPQPRSFVRYNRLADGNDKPEHRQVPILINGKYTTVDHKLEPLIIALNRLGFVTRYSCQGSKKKLAYITFEGNVAHTAILREMSSFEEDEFFASLNDDADKVQLKKDRIQDTFESLWYAEHRVISYRGHAQAGVETTMPAMESEWQVDFQRQSSRLLEVKHTIRFPKSDIKDFTLLVETLWQAKLKSGHDLG